MLILGTDVGLAHFGFGLIDWTPNSIELFRCGTVNTHADLATQLRCRCIRDRLLELGEFDFMVLEEQQGAWRGGEERGETNQHAVKARIAEGVARGMALERDRPVLELTPAAIRAALGLPAGASKKQLAEMVARRCRNSARLPGFLTAEQELARASNHATDAVAAAIAGGPRYNLTMRMAEASRAQFDRAVTRRIARAAR